MVRKLKVRRIAGSFAAIIPQDLLDDLQIEADGEIFAATTASGVLLLPYDPSFEKSMMAFEVVRKRYRETLSRLLR